MQTDPKLELAKFMRNYNNGNKIAWGEIPWEIQELYLEMAEAALAWAEVKQKEAEGAWSW